MTAYTWKVDDIVSAKYDGKFYYADIMANTGPTVLVYFHQDGQTAHVSVQEYSCCGHISQDLVVV